MKREDYPLHLVKPEYHKEFIELVEYTGSVKLFGMSKEFAAYVDTGSGVQDALDMVFDRQAKDMREAFSFLEGAEDVLREPKTLVERVKDFFKK